MQGKSNLIQVLSSVIGGIGRDASESDELRTYLNKVAPEQYPTDVTKKMGVGALRGAVNAYETQQKQQAIALTQDNLRSMIAQRTREGNQDQAMSTAFAQARPIQQQQIPANVIPGIGMGAPIAPGSTLPPISVGTQGPMTRSSLLSAMAQNPGSEQTPTGRSIIAEWFRGASDQPGQGVIPFTMGTGDNTLSGIIETRTGALKFDPETEARRAKARASASKSAQPPRTPSGTGPTLSKDGKYYWDEHLGSWKPTSSKSQSLFNLPDSTSATGTGKPLTDPKIAKQFLDQAGGDKEKARDLARAAGYDF